MKVNSHIKLFITMHNLKSNYDKFFQLINKNCYKMFVTEGNFKHYPNPPKMSDVSIISLSLCSEAIGVDSENYFWKKLQWDYQTDFPNLIDRSRFNRRKKRLACYIKQINEHLATLMSEGENTFIVDSVPIPVCHIAREKRSKICREHFETAPDKGFSSISQSYFYGYKLHLITSLNGVFQAMDMTKASVHDVQYLNDVKNSSLNNCTLIADKGYLSAQYKIDLFAECNISLQTPQRTNQINFKPFAPVFKKCRRRIETLFSQLCDQLMLKRNYAKSFVGLATRILCKISAITFLQSFNIINNKPTNHFKFALCF